MIQPIKVEIMWLAPEIHMYRDFVSDSEIERLKELANPKVSSFSLVILKCLLF